MQSFDFTAHGMEHQGWHCEHSLQCHSLVHCTKGTSPNVAQAVEAKGEDLVWGIRGGDQVPGVTPGDAILFQHCQAAVVPVVGRQLQQSRRSSNM